MSESVRHRTWEEDFTPVEMEGDYVVVGSGAGGATAAVSLARGGAQVVLVEAGAWRAPEDYPNSMYGTLRDLMDDWCSLVTRGRALWPIVQGRTVGGTTVINSAIVVRTPDDIFEEWERDHGFGGEPLRQAIGRIQDQLDGELHVSPVPEATQGRVNELARKGAMAIGAHDHHMNRNVRDCLGHGQCLQGCQALRKQSTNLNFVPETLDRGGVLLSSAPVDQVVFEGQRAIGVRGVFRHPRTGKRGGPYFVRARRGVIVAASATHSPALLLRSGVKLPALGAHFRAHPGTGVFGRYADPVHPNTGATQGWASTAFRGDPGFKLETLSLPLELVASRLPGAGLRLLERLESYPHLAMWCVAIRAEASGRVTAGWGGRPVVRYGPTRRDVERLRHGVHVLAKMHVAAGADMIVPGIHGLPYELRPDQVDLIMEAPLDPRFYVGILSHLFGGCVMGSDPKRSVCDGQGRVHGYEGLLIADASAIPTTLGVNPQHTIMALARHHAEALLDR